MKSVNLNDVAITKLFHFHLHVYAAFLSMKTKM